MPTIPQQSHRLLLIDHQVVHQPNLLLLEALARVEPDRGRVGRLRVGSKLLGGKTQRVLRIGSRHDIRDERQPVGVIE